MDTSPGRTHARIVEAEDFLPGGTQYEQRMGGSREGGIPRGPVQKDGQRKVLTCFFCRKPGHFARDCRQKRYGNQGPPCTYPGQQRSNQPVTCARQTLEEEGTIRRVAENKTLQQRAMDWLSGVMDEEDNVKDIVMQELMGGRIFKMPEPNGLGEGSSL
jgi:hypothetical protein